MNTYRTTSPRILGRRLATLVVGLVFLGSVWAPRALATQNVPERVRTPEVAVRHLTVAQLRREAAADHAEHLRWAGATAHVWLGYERLFAEAAADHAEHVRAIDR